MLLFCQPNLQQLFFFKRILRGFHIISGLKINFSKSCLIGINVDQQDVLNWVDCIKCKIGQLPTTYLGLPLVLILIPFPLGNQLLINFKIV